MRPGSSGPPTALMHGPPRAARSLGSAAGEAGRGPTSSRPPPRGQGSSPRSFLRGAWTPPSLTSTSRNSSCGNSSPAPWSSWTTPPSTKPEKPGRSSRGAATRSSSSPPTPRTSTPLRSTLQTSRKSGHPSRREPPSMTSFDCTVINGFYYKSSFFQNRFFLQGNQFLKGLIVQLAQPRFIRSHNRFGELQFLLNHLINALF